MTAEHITTTTGISRRRLGAAALWSVPVIAVATAAPAAAISPGQCYTMNWVDGTASIASNYGSATYTAPTGAVNGQQVTIGVNQVQTAGAAASYYEGSGAVGISGKVGVNRNFVGYTTGSQRAVAHGGTDANTGGTHKFTVAAGSTSSVMVLNQGSGSNGPASQTLTFSLGSTSDPIPKSVSFNIYDITAVNDASSNTNAKYVDRVTVSGGTMAAGAVVGGPNVTRTANTLTGTGQSSDAGSYVPVTLTGLTSNSFSLTYSNPGQNNTVGSSTKTQFNAQYIGLGDVKVCY